MGIQQNPVRVEDGYRHLKIDGIGAEILARIVGFVRGRAILKRKARP